MKRSIPALLSIAVVGAALCGAPASFAQSTPPAGAAAGEGERQHWEARRHEHEEAMAKALREILRLRPDQENAFQAFLTAQKPPEGWREDHDRHDADKAGAMTTPERLDRMSRMIADRDAMFKRRADATRTFYAQLNAEQKRVFDDLGILRGGHGPRHEGERHEGEGHEGEGHEGPGGHDGAWDGPRDQR